MCTQVTRAGLKSPAWCLLLLDPGTRVQRVLTGRELPFQQRGQQWRQQTRGQGRECQQLVIQEQSNTGNHGQRWQECSC